MRLLASCLLLIFSHLVIAQTPDHGVDIQPISINKRDIAAQQRGAGLFFNYCSSCHSLKQSRYSDIARDLKILTPQGAIDKNAIFKYLNHVSDNPYDTVTTSLDKKQAEQWLGQVPPDLSLVTRSRGPSWVAAFLKEFTLDDSRPWGVNNNIMPNTAMPHALIDLQGYDVTGHLANVDHPAYEQAVHDLVSFLTYAGEPRALEREIMGKYVLLFLALMVLVSYLYYESVWAGLERSPPEEKI